MWPTLYEIQTSTGGTMGFHTYGMWILLAFCSAFMMVLMRYEQVRIRMDQLVIIFLAAAVSGMAGARVLYSIAVEPGLWGLLTDPLSLIRPAGFAVYGGLIGGTLGVAVAALSMGIRPWKLADIAAPGVLFAMGVGRLGCLSAGCCHGAEVELHGAVGLLPQWFTGGQIWLAPHFPFVATEFSSAAGGVSRLTDVPLYPTQLWSAILGLTFGSLLFWLWNHRRFDGQIAGMALMIEPIQRIISESFRADHRGVAVSWQVPEWVASALPGLTQAGADIDGAVMGLTTSQAIGLVMFAAGVLILALQRNAGIDEEDDLKQGQDAVDDWVDEVQI